MQSCQKFSIPNPIPGSFFSYAAPRSHSFLVGAATLTLPGNSVIKSIKTYF